MGKLQVDVYLNFGKVTVWI